jgi:hypothetical protein
MVVFPNYTTSPMTWNTQLRQDGCKIQIKAIATSFVIFGALMKILFIISVKFVMLIKRSYMSLPPPPPVMLSIGLKMVDVFEHVAQSLLYTCLSGVPSWIHT